MRTSAAAPARTRLARRRDLLLVALYVALAALPVGAMVLGVRGRALHGAVEPAPRPRLGVGAVLSEDYQRRFTAWFERHLGLKGTSVAADNAILYHAFRETKQGSTVRLGRDGVLFIDEDINYFNAHGPHLADPARVERVADQIADLQRRLAARRRAVVPVIVPAKTSIWRDEVSGPWTLALGEPRPSDVHTYRAFAAALARRGVAFVDVRALFERLIASGAAPRTDLWGADARHWSVYGGCLALREVSHAYARLTGRPRPPHECRLVRRPAGRSHDDFDLWRLLNALAVPAAVEALPLVQHAPPDPAIPRPRTLLVGTSFFYTLVRDAGDSGLYGELHLSYYNSTFVPWSGGTDLPVEPGTPAWRAVTMEKDLYVLDLFEGYLGTPGYLDQFLAQILAELDRAPP